MDSSRCFRAACRLVRGVTVESDSSLHDGQSANLRPPTRRPYGWVTDDSVQPFASPPRAIQAQSAPTSPSAGSRQLLEGLLVALVPSSLGLIAYAILREAYVWFYQRYGVAPEELGLTQVRMLSSMFRFIHLWGCGASRAAREPTCSLCWCSQQPWSACGTGCFPGSAADLATST
jgi:hypothetical protein